MNFGGSDSVLTHSEAISHRGLQRAEEAEAEKSLCYSGGQSLS